MQPWRKKIKIKSLFFFFLSSSRLSGLYFVILTVSQASRAAPQAILNPPVLFSYYRGIVAGLTSSSRLYLVLPPVMYLLFFIYLFCLPPLKGLCAVMQRWEPTARLHCPSSSNNLQNCQILLSVRRPISSLPFLSVSMVTSQEADRKTAQSENTRGLSSDNNCGHPSFTTKKKNHKKYFFLLRS